MPGFNFRVALDLTAFFEDYRSKCYIYVDVSKLKSIHDLEKHIRLQFKIQGNLFLTTNGFYLPSSQSIEILNTNEILTVCRTGPQPKCTDGLRKKLKSKKTQTGTEEWCMWRLNSCTSITDSSTPKNGLLAGEDNGDVSHCNEVEKKEEDQVQTDSKKRKKEKRKSEGTSDQVDDSPKKKTKKASLSLGNVTAQDSDECPRKKQKTMVSFQEEGLLTPYCNKSKLIIKDYTNPVAYPTQNYGLVLENHNVPENRVSRSQKYELVQENSDGLEDCASRSLNDDGLVCANSNVPEYPVSHSQTDELFDEIGIIPEDRIPPSQDNGLADENVIIPKDHVPYSDDDGLADEIIIPEDRVPPSQEDGLMENCIIDEDDGLVHKNRPVMEDCASSSQFRNKSYTRIDQEQGTKESEDLGLEKRLANTGPRERRANTGPRPRRTRVRKRKAKKSSIHSIPTWTPVNNKFAFTPPKMGISPSNHVRFQSEDEMEEIEGGRSVVLSVTKWDQKPPERSSSLPPEQGCSALTLDEVLMLPALKPQSSVPVFDCSKTKETCSEIKEDELDITSKTTSSPMEGLPRKNDLIAFKMFRLSNQYTPGISNHITARVLDYDSDICTVKLQVLKGADQLSQPKGRFSLEDETNKSRSEIVELNWNEMIEPVLLFP